VGSTYYGEFSFKRLLDHHIKFWSVLFLQRAKTPKLTSKNKEALGVALNSLFLINFERGHCFYKIVKNIFKYQSAMLLLLLASFISWVCSISWDGPSAHSTKVQHGCCFSTLRGNQYKTDFKKKTKRNNRTILQNFYSFVCFQQVSREVWSLNSSPEPHSYTTWIPKGLGKNMESRKTRKRIASINCSGR
jgi:hypothetical protein